MQLRNLTLAGEYIHARLKSSTLHQAPSLDPVAVVLAEQVARRRRKKRGPRRNKKKILEHENEGRSWEKKKSVHSRTLSYANESRQETPDPPPLLGKIEFPGLLEGTAGSMSYNDNVLALPEQRNEFSLPFRSNKVSGGYAAALLKPGLPSTEEKTAKEVAPAGGGDRGAKHVNERLGACVLTQQKSFADVVRASSFTP